jgi:hypothetical protein
MELADFLIGKPPFTFQVCFKIFRHGDWQYLKVTKTREKQNGYNVNSFHWIFPDIRLENQSKKVQKLHAEFSRGFLAIVSGDSNLEKNRIEKTGYERAFDHCEGQVPQGGTELVCHSSLTRSF